MNQQNLEFPSSNLPVIDSMPVERQRAQSLLSQARKCYQQNRNFEAMELIDQSLSLFRIGQTLYYRGLILNKIKRKREGLTDLKEAVLLYDRCLNVGAFYQQWLHTHIPACLEVAQLQIQLKHYQIAASYIDKAGLLNMSYEVGFDSSIEAKREVLQNAKVSKPVEIAAVRNSQVCDDILQQIKKKDIETRQLEESKNEVLDFAPPPQDEIFQTRPALEAIIAPEPKFYSSDHQEEDPPADQYSVQLQSLREEVDYNLKRRNYKVALYVVDQYLEKQQNREGFLQRSKVLQYLGRKAEAKAYANLASQFLQ